MTFKVNKQTATKRRLVQCSIQINRESVRRENIAGIEHVIVSSYTLPDDVVMNGVLYPAEEIANSFHTLERTLAPVEHPVGPNGEFISASDPYAINNFYAGAYNMNVSQKDGRVHIEKHINVLEANKSDRGKRLLDRIAELENSETPRPIHTSVGVFIAIEDTPEPMTNVAGDEYTMIARDMYFDHDAILLDSTGAATPEKGVGMAVNKAGEKIEVDRASLPGAGKAVEFFANADYKHGEFAVLYRMRAQINAADDMSDIDRDALNEFITKRVANLDMASDGLSLSKVFEDLDTELRDTVAFEWLYVVDVIGSDVIFETNQGYFIVPWLMDDNGNAKVAGIPMRVDREITYSPKTNAKAEGDAMKELIMNALKEAGIETENLSDDQLLQAYNSLQSPEAGDELPKNDGADSEVVAALNSLKEQVGDLQSQLNSQTTAEVEKLAELVGNSDKYPGIDADTAKALPVAKLRELAANCGGSVGLPLVGNDSTGADKRFAAPSEMPA